MNARDAITNDATAACRAGAAIAASAPRAGRLAP
jgi:hypothetical protein